MANGNLDDWFREKFLGTPPYVPPQPARFYAGPRPVPIAVPPANVPQIPVEQPQAALVSSVDHPRGRGHAGLVNGR